MGVVAQLYNDSISSILGFGMFGWRTVYNNTAGLFNSGCLVAFGLHGVGIYFGRIQNVNAAIWRVLMICLTMAIWAKWRFFQEELMMNVMYLPDWFARDVMNSTSNGFSTTPAAIGCTSIPTIGGALETTLCNANKAAEVLWTNSASYDVAAIVLCLLIYISVAVYVGVAIGLLIMAKAAGSILLMVGPFFVVFSLFGPTRQYCMSWLSNLLNYLILQILIFCALALFNQAAATVAVNITQATGAPNAFLVLPFVVAVLAGFMVMIQLPTISSSLTGSAALGTDQFLQFVAAKATAGASLLKGAINPAPKEHGKGAKGLNGTDLSGQRRTASSDLSRIGGTAQRAGAIARGMSYYAANRARAGMGGVARHSRGMAFYTASKIKG